MMRQVLLAAGAALCVVLGGPALAQPVHERDHAWVVDQDGRETPIYGCWELVSVTHPQSNGEIGQIAVFGDDPLENEFTVEGIIRGPDGWLWSQVLIGFEGGPEFSLLERVDTHANPHRWHIAALLTEEGDYQPAYAEDPEHFTGDHPLVDMMVFERVSCAAAM